MASMVFFSPDLRRSPLLVPWQFSGALGKDHRISIVGPATGPVWEPLRDKVEPAAVLPGRNPLSREVVRCATEAARGADLLYAFKALPESLGVALRVGKALDLPVALHLCDWDAGYFSDRSLARRIWYGLRGLTDPSGPVALHLTERLIPRADVLTVSSTALQRRFGGEVVPQGVDTEAIFPDAFPREEARARLGIKPGELLVLFLGTPVPHKGLLDLARAWRALDRPGVRFMIVGAGLAGDELLALPEFAGAELHPPVPVDEAPWVIRAADVYAVPQRDTPFARHQLPAKLLLGMALGAPCITTEVGDAPAILGGEPPAGVMVPPGDLEGLTSSLDALLDDPELRSALGEEARRRAVDRYSWEAMRSMMDPILEPWLSS